MSTAVVYCSQTGYTRTYARWLAESLGTEALPFERRDEAAASGADTLVFLSWFHAGGSKARNGCAAHGCAAGQTLCRRRRRRVPHAERRLAAKRYRRGV